MNDPLRILVDSDAFVALTVETDAHHEKAVSLLQRLGEKQVTFLTSNYVFSESITVISMKSSHATAVEFIDTMLSAENPFEIKRADYADEKEAITVFRTQTSKNTSYVDCLNMVFMSWRNLDAIFSFDSVYKKKGFPLVEDLFAKAVPPQPEPEEAQAAS
jgi:predicted nucleic acid-binding protein